MTHDGIPTPAQYREACDYLGLRSPVASGQAMITAYHWLGHNGSPQAKTVVERALICILRYHQSVAAKDQGHAGPS